MSELTATLSTIGTENTINNQIVKGKITTEQTNTTLNPEEKIDGIIKDIDGAINITINKNEVVKASMGFGVDYYKGDKGEKGNTGDKGDKGEKGDTPVKGVDYFTKVEQQNFITTIQSQVDGLEALTNSDILSIWGEDF